MTEWLNEWAANMNIIKAFYIAVAISISVFGLSIINEMLLEYLEKRRNHE